MKLNKKEIITFFLYLVPIIFILVLWLGFGDRGLLNLHRMEKERDEYIERIQRLEKENQRLWAEINRLRTDREYIESLARKKLGLLKENEVIFKFKNESYNLDEGN